MTQSLTTRVNTELRNDGCQPCEAAAFNRSPRPLAASASVFGTGKWATVVGNRKLTLSRHTPLTTAIGEHCCVHARCAASEEYKSMKSRETLIRLRKFQVDEKRRRVAQIETMIFEFERIAGELDREI